jgi:hypothetical protein
MFRKEPSNKPYLENREGNSLTVKVPRKAFEQALLGKQRRNTSKLRKFREKPLNTPYPINKEEDV